MSDPRSISTTSSTPSFDFAVEAGVFERWCHRVDAALSIEACAAELLSQVAASTGSTRASLMLVNPASGSMFIAAAVGLPAELIGHDVPARPHSISDWVMRHRRGLVLNGAIEDRRFTGLEQGRVIESALSLPLATESGPIGVLNLARPTPAPVFTDADLEAMQRLLAPVGVALDRLQRLGLAERAAAERGPATLFAPGAEEVRNYAFGLSHVRALRTTGDVCDRASHADGSQSIMMVDVGGSDAELARTAAFAQGLFVATAGPERSVSGLAARLNAELHSRHRGATTASLWIAHFGKSGEMSTCAAGAPEPFWVPSDGGAITRLGSGGPACGLAARSRFDEEHVRLLPGDMVIGVSDGLLGATGRGDRRIADTALIELLENHRREPLDRLTQALCDAALEHAGRPRPTDDVVAAAVRFQPSR